MRKIISFFLALLLFASACSVSAAEVRSEEEFYLNKGEKINDDLYAAGGILVVSGDVYGDLFAVGGNVTIDGNVAADLNVGGGSIDVLGNVGDDLRVGGGKITVSKNVGGDLLAGGGFVHILSGAVISGDVLIGGGAVIIDGIINGDVKVGGGDVIINGRVMGNIRAEVENSLQLGRGAFIGGDLNYKARSEMEFSEQAEIRGEVLFEKSKRGARPAFSPLMIVGPIAGLFAIKFLAYLLLSILLVLLFNKFSKEIVDRCNKNFGKEFIRGIILIIICPLAIFLLLISLIGSVLGILIALSLAMLIILAKVFAGIFLGYFIFKIFTEKKKRSKIKIDWKIALVGIVFIHLIILVPIFGWLLYLIVFMSSFGCLLFYVYERFWLKR